MEFFGVAHGVSKGFQGSELFQIFPEARQMLLAWAKENSEMAHGYLLTIVIPYCWTVCNEELEEHRLLKALEPAEFIKFVRLKMLNVTTDWRWLKQLGFTYSKDEKCYYTGGHEKAENVRYRLKFIKRYFEHELRTFHWVQLSEGEAKALKVLEKNSLKEGLGHSFTNDDGCPMR
jgi:hypothetical protein